MNKVTLGVGAVICVGILGIGIFYAVNKPAAVTPGTIVEMPSVGAEKVVYSKVLGHTDRGWLRSRLLIAAVDGSGKEVLIEDIAADFLFVPERDEVVVLDHGEQKIEILSLRTREWRTVFDAKKFGTEFIGDGLPGTSMALLSADKTQLVFPAGNQYAEHSKVVLLNLVDHSVPAKIIYSPGHSVVLRYWDAADRIYGYPDAHKGICTPPTPQFSIRSSGQKAKTAFDLEEFFNGENLPSPNRNYFISSRENPQGPLFLGMCDFRAQGVLKLYSVQDDAVSILASDPSKNFLAKQWTADSRHFVYEVSSYPQWSGNPADTAVGSERTEGFVVYNVASGTNLVLRTQTELNAWLKNNDSGAQHTVKFSETTATEYPEDKNLYIDGVLVDSVEKLPWGGGPAVFTVLGFTEN